MLAALQAPHPRQQHQQHSHRGAADRLDALARPQPQLQRLPQEEGGSGEQQQHQQQGDGAPRQAAASSGGGSAADDDHYMNIHEVAGVSPLFGTQ